MAEERRITKQYLLDHLDENELDLSMIHLSKVPVKELAQITRATKLDLSRNQLTTLPDTISTLRHTLELDLSNNQLEQLPESFGQLTQLQRLDLYGNRLTDLPLSFCELKKLRWLDLKKNPLNEGLAKAAGGCLSEKECKECARNVLVYMEEMAEEAEIKRKRALRKKAARERKRKEEERQRREEAKKAKAEVRQRRKEEKERMEAERRAQEEADGEREEDDESSSEDADRQATITRRPLCSKLCGCVCWTLLVLIVLVKVVVIGSLLLCDHVYEATTCKELHHTASDWLHHLLDMFGVQYHSV